MWLWLEKILSCSRNGELPPSKKRAQATQRLLDKNEELEEELDAALVRRIKKKIAEVAE